MKYIAILLGVLFLSGSSFSYRTPDFYDLFNRSNENLETSSEWDNASSGSLVVASNRIEQDNTSSSRHKLTNMEAYNFVLEADVCLDGENEDQDSVGFFFRADMSAVSFYYAWVEYDTASYNACRIGWGLYLSGAFQGFTFGSTNYAATDVLKLRIVASGNNVTIFVNGTQQLTTSNGHYTGGANDIYVVCNGGAVNSAWIDSLKVWDND